MIAIYARVSTEEQAKHGFSLADQVREGKIKAGTDAVIEYVDEGVSGEFLDRPALTQLRHDVRTGKVHQVVCLDPDRLSRKLMNQLILSDEIEAHAQLVFVNGEYARTPEGQLFYQMRGAISQFEKAKINERMSRGRREKARQGRVLRDFHIYGYQYDAAAEQFVVNDREAAVVRLVFALFTNPEGQVKGINGIAKYLNDCGIPSKRGGTFHRQVVRQMLSNRAYIGEFYQNKWDTEGMLGNRYKPAEERIRQKLRPQSEWIRLSIPAIIDPEQFAYAQQLLEVSRRRWAGRRRRVYLLGGLVRCMDCGNTMTGRTQRMWGRQTFLYTDRKSAQGAKHPGCGTDIRCEELDALVWDHMMEWVSAISPAELVGGFDEPRVLGHEAQLRHITDELARLQVAQDRLLRLLLDPVAEELDVRLRIKECQERKQRLTAQRAEIEAKLDHAKERSDRRFEVLQGGWEKIGHVAWTTFDEASKQELIRTLVREVRVYDRGRRIEIHTM